METNNTIINERSERILLLRMATDIVSASIAARMLLTGEVPAYTEAVFDRLSSLGKPATAPAEQTKPTPAVNPKRSITDNHIICLEDGKKFKSLKRHLMASYGMTPDQYRQKWGLDADYPMVAPNYAVARSQLAKKMGLGKSRQRRSVN